jgi:predicted AAA+ superfamily ATPase
MKTYYKRVYDEPLSFRLRSKSAVIVEGPKWCGKTTTAAQQAQSILYLKNQPNRKIATSKIESANRNYVISPGK